MSTSWPSTSMQSWDSLKPDARLELVVINESDILRLAFIFFGSENYQTSLNPECKQIHIKTDCSSLFVHEYLFLFDSSWKMYYRLVTVKKICFWNNWNVPKLCFPSFHILKLWKFYGTKKGVVQLNFSGLFKYCFKKFHYVDLLYLQTNIAKLKLILAQAWKSLY